MKHDDSDIVDTKGTFKVDGMNHTFRARFAESEKEPLLLKIDDKEIYFNESRQNEIMDNASKNKRT